MSETKRVFLGGTCNESLWRKELISQLQIEYFNPVVDDWTPECMAEELRQRELCHYVLYVLTPKMTGVYAVAEVVDDSNKRPERTLFCVLARDADLLFTGGQLKSLDQVKNMVRDNGAKVFDCLKCVAKYLND